MFCCVRFNLIYSYLIPFQGVGVTSGVTKLPCYTAMGSILKRKRKDGTIGYTAIIRIKRGGVLVHSETETLDREAAAKAWLNKREAALSLPGALDKVDDPTLADVIDVYNKDKLRPHGKTKDQVLRTIQKADIGALRCSQIDSQALIKFAQSIKAQPQTVGNYMSHLASVMSVAKPAWGYPLDKQAMDDARVVMSKMGMISKSKQRTRRPTLGELDRLMVYFSDQLTRRPSSIPMARLVLFALYSTRRQEEITRMTWADLLREHSEVVIRDMKNPGEKIGNDVRTTLPPEALQLIDAQGVATGATSGSIWPYNADSISAAWARACKFLGIDDLHFHDLRHEGITRLFEMEWSIPRVATVSGHRSWQSLQRYTQYKAAGDKYAGWAWLAKILTA